MVEGKKPNPSAIFFEQAVLDVPASKTAGRRIYTTKLYIKLSQPGVADSMSYEAQKADISTYSDEYQYFLQNRQGTRSPGVEIIPNLDIAHLQELRDYGILTIPKLAEMEVVPPHLEYAHRAAKVFNKALKETSNEIHEEKDGEERKTSLAPDRQQHRDDVSRHHIPTSDRSNQREEVTERNGTDRRAQRGHAVIPGTDWSMEFPIQ